MDRVKVIISDTQKVIKIPTGIRMLIRRTCTAVLACENFKGSAEVNVTFVDNEKIREINKTHRNIDKVTDVLSFPLGENGKYDVNPETNAQMLGDIIISVEKATEQAKELLHSLRREIAYLIAHSMLHLLGYDHIENMDKLHMREKEENVMCQLGLSELESMIIED